MMRSPWVGCEGKASTCRRVSSFRHEPVSYTHLKDTGTAVLVFPGGDYRVLALDLEGTEVCAWLNSIGVTGVLLKYRVPRRQGQAPFVAPLQDAQRAMGLVRLHAKELSLSLIHI